MEPSSTMKALVDLTPPAGVSVVTFLGYWLPPVVYLLTAVYTILRIYFLVTDKARERRERAQAAKHAEDCNCDE